MVDLHMEHLAYINEVYDELAVLNQDETYKTVLVRHKENGEILVKKQIPLSQGGIYQQIQSIENSHLIKVHEVCYTNAHCIVMEDYVSGRTVQELLEESGRLSYEDTMNYLVQVLEGLSEIHKYHIIHRDLKPENILISTDGVVKLLDFGIARFQKENQSKDTTILGTVGYASPEQFGFRQTDVRTDIYSVGILLNKMLTGKMPDEELPEDEKIRRVVLKCTEIDPINRYESVESLRNELWGTKGRNYSRSTVCENVWQTQQEDITWIPGFRTGVRWKKIVASIGYIFFMLGSIIYIVDVMQGGFMAVVLELIAVLIYIWLPVAIGTNLFQWDSEVPVFRSLPKELRFGLRLLLCVVVFYLGLMLDNYVRYTIVGLPRPN